MYPDVSEGHNFASVCVLFPSCSLSRSLSVLFSPRPSSRCPLSLRVYHVLLRSPLSPNPLRSLPLPIFPFLQGTTVPMHTCACVRGVAGRLYPRVRAGRRYTCIIPAHVPRKIRSAGMLGGYVSERYPSMRTPTPAPRPFRKRPPRPPINRRQRIPFVRAPVCVCLDYRARRIV